MKTVTIRDLQKKIKDCVDEAQQDRIVITRRGKPAAVLVGVEGQEWENVILETNPTFWKLIQRRRKQSTLSLEQLKSQLKKSK
jgi:prevent-host-death family protein